ncbi:MAG: hypothetical protein ABI885_17310 [Gammaproteobacteria bacterium]
MECLLLLWDELDDWAGACRHVAGSAVAEVAVLSAPLAATGSAAAVWFLMPHPWVNTALVAGVATAWGVYRHVLRLAGV